MTVEELKTEAKKLGYNIIKIPEKIKRLNCICGAKPRQVELYYHKDGYRYSCSKCQRKSNICSTRKAALKDWNSLIENELNQKR